MTYRTDIIDVWDGFGDAATLGAHLEALARDGSTVVSVLPFEIDVCRVYGTHQVRKFIVVAKR